MSSVLAQGNAPGYFLSGVVLAAMGYGLLRRWRRLYDEDPDTAVELMTGRVRPGFAGLIFAGAGIIFLILGALSALSPDR